MLARTTMRKGEREREVERDKEMRGEERSKIERPDTTDCQCETFREEAGGVGERRETERDERGRACL
jgi:hypothetical protein